MENFDGNPLATFMQIVMNGDQQEMESAAIKLAGQGDPKILAPALLEGAGYVNQTRIPDSAAGAVNVQPNETPFIPMQGAQGVAPGYTPPSPTPPQVEGGGEEDPKKKEWGQAMMAFAQQQQQQRQGQGRVSPGASVAGGGSQVNLQTPGLFEGQQTDPMVGLLMRLRAGGY